MEAQVITPEITVDSMALIINDVKVDNKSPTMISPVFNLNGNHIFIILFSRQNIPSLATRVPNTSPIIELASNVQQVEQNSKTATLKRRMEEMRQLNLKKKANDTIKSPKHIIPHVIKEVSGVSGSSFIILLILTF